MKSTQRKLILDIRDLGAVEYIVLPRLAVRFEKVLNLFNVQLKNKSLLDSKIRVHNICRKTIYKIVPPHDIPYEHKQVSRHVQEHTRHFTLRPGQMHTCSLVRGESFQENMNLALTTTETAKGPSWLLCVACRKVLMVYSGVSNYLLMNIQFFFSI